MAADYSAEEIAQWARGLVRMLVFAICTDSILLGMTVRLAVTYARTFTRDPPLYRILVSLCLALSAGHTAAICAYLFNFISMTVIDISGERGLQTNTYITGRTFTAAAMCVAEAFFIARLFDVTRNLFVRCTAIVLWVTSTGLMIWWSVERTKNQRLYPIIRGKLGIAGIVTECLLLLTAALVAFFLMRELPRVRPPEELPKTRRQKFLYNSTLFIESSGLLAFDHLISVIHRFFALRYPTASLLTNYFYYLFPSISVFSVAFAINQRPPPPLPPAGTTSTCSKLGGTTSFNPPAMGGGEDIEQMQQEEQKRSFLAASASRGGSEMIASVSAATYDLNSFLGGGGGGSIIYDPDDPQTWRGDAQRVVPSIVRFDDVESGSFFGSGSGGGSGGGGEELSLAPRTYRPTPTSGKSLKGSAQSVKSWRGGGNVSLGGGGGERPGFGAAGGNSREGRSFLGVGGGGGGGSMGRVEYDEDLVDMDSTVVSLDLGAFAAVRETASSWGPKRVKEEEGEHLEAPSTPTTGSSNSNPSPNL